MMSWFTLVLVVMLSVGFGMHLDNQHIHKGVSILSEPVSLLPAAFIQGFAKFCTGIFPLGAATIELHAAPLQ